MATLLGKGQADESALISELSWMPPWRRGFEVFPDAVVFGSRWVDMIMFSTLMSPCVWYPARSVAAGTYAGPVAVPANRLVTAEKLVGKKGNVYVKYTIGGRPGPEIVEQARAFIRTQLRTANDDLRRKALDQLVGIYLDAKEEARQHAREFSGAIALGG